MMQASELRLGNWVQTKGKIHFRIDKMEHWGTDNSKCCMVASPVLHDWAWGLKDMQPIQITEELLLQINFTCFQDGGYKHESAPFTWSVYDNTVRFMGYSLNHIKSLHQLQNAFYSHSGVELEIVWEYPKR